MKTRTRIVTAITAALASLFVATPALAAEDAGSMFSKADDPLQVGAIITVGVVLLVIVLALAGLVGSLFDKKDA